MDLPKGRISDDVIPFLNNDSALLLIVAHGCSWLLMVASLVFVVTSMRYSFSETV